MGVVGHAGNALVTGAIVAVLACGGTGAEQRGALLGDPDDNRCGAGGCFTAEEWRGWGEGHNPCPCDLRPEGPENSVDEPQVDEPQEAPRPALAPRDGLGGIPQGPLPPDRGVRAGADDEHTGDDSTAPGTSEPPAPDQPTQAEIDRRVKKKKRLQQKFEAAGCVLVSMARVSGKRKGGYDFEVRTENPGRCRRHNGRFCTDTEVVYDWVKFGVLLDPNGIYRKSHDNLVGVEVKAAKPVAAPPGRRQPTPHRLRTSRKCYRLYDAIEAVGAI